MKNSAILCVDDEAIILLSLIQELKQRFGNTFLYEKATNAEDAMETVLDLARDGIKVILIISDWLMPGIKGDEFLEKITKQFPDIKAIMITGQADTDAITRVKKIPGVMAVLKKPWNNRELTDIISKACINC